MERELAGEIGVVATVLFMFVLRELWPAFRDRFLPWVSQARREQREADQKAAELEVQRENRLFTALENNTRATTEHTMTMQGVNQKQEQVLVSLQSIAMQLAVLIEKIDKKAGGGGRNKPPAGVPGD